MKTNLSLWLVATVVLTGMVLDLSWAQTAPLDPNTPASVPSNRVLSRALEIEAGRVQPRPYGQLLSSGPLRAVLQAAGELDRRAAAVAIAPDAKALTTLSSLLTQGCQDVLTAGSDRNIRVNQDCSLRFQAEEVLAINPTNSANLIAGYNDGRIGLNHCGYAWSFDGGQTWGNLVPPFWQFILLDGHTADACADPTATFDADGNAYIGGLLFDVNSAASAIVVAKSNAGIGGAFYHTPNATLSFQTFRTLPLGVVANDNNINIFNDKDFIVADANPGSPKKNNVYATWTRFNNATGAGTGENNPIFFSQSTDGGATWSAGIAISGANAAVCTAFSGSANPNACDQDQGSHPIVGPDGTIYVAFANFNTPSPGAGLRQTLFVSCPATADCRQPASWTAPVKIADLFGTHPFGPSAEGCASDRRCLPPNGYRVPEATSISIAVDSSSTLYAVWADFRNGGAPCTGPASTARPPCNNDIFFSVSTDGGATWSAPINVTPAATFGPTAQWQPWSAVTQDGTVLWVAYYDRSYGNCEFEGCNDITLAQVVNPASAPPTISYTRLTTASMPNLVPANNPFQAGFLGDYMWVAADGDGRPHVVWADTRGRNGTVEEDIYFATLDLLPPPPAALLRSR